MATFHHTDLKDDDLNQLEKPLSDRPDSHTSDIVEIPSGYFPATPEEKLLSRSLNRKLDIYLLPFLSLLYLFNGLDRGNVGNAQTQGLYLPLGMRRSTLTALKGSQRTLALSLMISTYQCHCFLLHLFSSNQYQPLWVDGLVRRIGFLLSW